MARSDESLVVGSASFVVKSTFLLVSVQLKCRAHINRQKAVVVKNQGPITTFGKCAVCRSVSFVV